LASPPPPPPGPCPPGGGGGGGEDDPNPVHNPTSYQRCCRSCLCHPCHLRNRPGEDGPKMRRLSVPRRQRVPGSGGGGGSTIARSFAMHLVDASRVNWVNFSIYLHRLARVVATLAHPVDRDDKDSNGSRLEGSGGGPGRSWTYNLHYLCAHSRDGLQGGPWHVCLGGEQHPGKLDNGAAVMRRRRQRTSSTPSQVAGAGVLPS
jgi:hypothetical protein